MTPIVRWAGGKRWLLEHLAAVVDSWAPSAFHEPFAGGAAVLLGFDWPRPHLSDVNPELVATYRGIRDDPEEIRHRLRPLPVDRATYERMKSSAPRSDVNRAVRMLYLNRCGYGGIYRTDRHGTFNVPFSGDRPTTSLWANGRLTRLSGALRGVEISCGDFAETLESVEAGAVVYCDPAYALPDGGGAFTRYSRPAFGWADQLRLADVVHDLRRRGALVLVSNSADDRVAGLFSGGMQTTFERRVPLPKAYGAECREALYVLGDPVVERVLERRLGETAV